MRAFRPFSALGRGSCRGLNGTYDRQLRVLGSTNVSFPRNFASDAARGTFGVPGVAGKLSRSSHELKKHPRDNFVRGYHDITDIPDKAKELARKAEDLGYAVLHGRGRHTVDGFLVFGPQFLRENCQCPKCVHPDTRQRATDPFLIPSTVSIESYKSSTDGATQVKWSDGHEALYPAEWLLEHQQRDWQVGDSIGNLPALEKALPPPRECKQFKFEEETEPPFVLYEQVMSSDTHVREWLEHIWLYGFCLVKNVPATPEATKDLLERIAHIRHTHYGGFWDFTADLTFKDTAYTNEGLAPHTDNTYFSDPARLQLFHLLSHTDGSGGESTLLDGFAAAKKLHEEAPSLYNSLATVRHSWHSSGNEDVCIQPSTRAPVFSIHPDFGTVYQVRWNYYDRLPKNDWSLAEQNTWYEAARRYYQILNEPGRVLEMQLKPGTALIFDNWRMMHGRTEFTGKRRMCGGYTNNDDFISRLRLLKFGRQKVLQKMGSYWESGHPSNPYSVY